MSEAQLINADPTVESPTPAVKEEEFREHIGTYNKFVHLAFWFCIHVPLLLGGIYVATLGGSMSGGIVLIVAGVAVLIYGIVSTAGREITG